MSIVFADPKDAHRIIGQARRDIHMKALYTEGKYKADGFEPVPKPADIKSMEEECGKPLPVNFTILGSVEREGKHYLTFPETTTLKVTLKEAMAKRYEEIKKGFPPPPAPKRVCTSAAGSAGLAPNTCVPMQQIVEKFILLKNEPITIAGQEFKILKAQSKLSGSAHHLLYNCSASRRTIPQKVHFTSTSSGIFVDQKDPGSRAMLRENAIAWPWKLTCDSMFCHSFSAGGSEVIENWGNMIQNARRVGGGGTEVYAHSFSDPTDSVPSPVPRDSVDVYLVLPEVSDVGMQTASLGDYFTKFDIADLVNATVRPCYRVRLSRGLVVPVVERRPMDFITAKAFTMEPNSVMLVTTSLQ